MISVRCPSCSKKIKAPEKYAGKKVKCPGCKTGVVIPEVVTQETPSTDFDPDDFMGGPAEDTPTALPPKRRKVSASKQQTETPEASETEESPKSQLVALKAMQLKLPVVIAISAVIGVGGYLIGRWHIRHQIASAFTEAGEAFSEGMKSGFGVEVAGDTEKEPATVVEWGGKHTTDTCEISLVSAEVKKPTFENYSGDPAEGATAYLLLTFQVANRDSRKELEIDQYSFDISAKDDVGNRLQGFAVPNKIYGAIKDKLAPEETGKHVRPLSIPLPKTEQLEVSVKWEPVGDILFKIPAENIQR